MTYGKWYSNGIANGRSCCYMDRDAYGEDSIFVWWSSGNPGEGNPSLPKGWWCSVADAPAEKCVGPFPTMRVAKAMALLLPKAEE